MAATDPLRHNLAHVNKQFYMVGEHSNLHQHLGKRNIGDNGQSGLYVDVQGPEVKAAVVFLKQLMAQLGRAHPKFAALPIQMRPRPPMMYPAGKRNNWRNVDQMHGLSVPYECLHRARANIMDKFDENTTRVHVRTVTRWLSTLPAAIELKIVQPQKPIEDEAPHGVDPSMAEGGLELLQEVDILEGNSDPEDGIYPESETESDEDEMRFKSLDRKHVKRAREPTRILPPRTGRPPTGAQVDWTIRFADDWDVQETDDSSTDVTTASSKWWIIKKEDVYFSRSWHHHTSITCR